MSLVTFLSQKCAELDINECARSGANVADILSEACLKEYSGAKVSILCILSGGNCFTNPLTVHAAVGNTFSYVHHFVIAVDGVVFDPVHGYVATPVNEYFKSAILSETKDFRFDSALTTGADEVVSLFDDEVRPHYKPKA